MKNKYAFSLLLIALMFAGKTQLSAQVTTYFTPPYSTGFESGVLDANWYTTASDPGGRIQIWNSTSLIWGGATAMAHTDSLWLGMDNTAGGTFVTTESWMGFDMTGVSQMRLSFWFSEWNDETQIEDGVFISDDGGVTFTKVLDLNGPDYTDLQWYHFDMSLDSINTLHGLTFTSTYVIKFQQHDNYAFAGGNDGFLFDDIDLYEPCTGPLNGTDTRTECNSLTWIDGNDYTANNNTATFNIVGGASNGCDSIVTLDLTINTVDVSVTSNDPDITANATIALYQWLDCDNNNAIISGATTQTYTATANGNYAVEITENNCVDTSICVTITTVGIKTNPIFNQVSIFPNPNKGLVNIALGSLKDVSIAVFNVTGQVVYTDENINNSSYQFKIKEGSGIYFIELNTNNKKKKYKLVIE